MPMPMVSKYAAAYRQALSDSPDDRLLNNSVAMCYLKLKVYDKAIVSFEKAIEDNFDNSETFFYAAICLLQGRKAYSMPRNIIAKIEEYINAALMIEPRGIYYYFLAYIKYDYFERKFFNTTPTYQAALQMAHDSGIAPSHTDIEQLYGVLGVSRPETL